MRAVDSRCGAFRAVILLQLVPSGRLEGMPRHSALSHLHSHNHQSTRIADKLPADGPPQRSFGIQRSLFVPYSLAEAQIDKDVKAVARAAHISSVLLNGLGESDSDVVEEIAAKDEGKGDAMCVVGALHGVTWAFRARAMKPENRGIARIANEILLAGREEPLLSEIRRVCNECRSGNSIAVIGCVNVRLTHITQCRTLHAQLQKALCSRLHIMDAEATHSTTNFTRHLGSTALDFVAAVIVFARSRDAPGDALLKPAVARRIAAQICGVDDKAKKDEDEDGEESEPPCVLSLAEAALEQFRASAGKLAVLNVARRAAGAAQLYHTLLRTRVNALSQGKAKTARQGTPEHAAAVRAVHEVDRRLERWEGQWRAVWPPHQICTLTTRESLQAAASSLENGA